MTPSASRKSGKLCPLNRMRSTPPKIFAPLTTRTHTASPDFLDTLPPPTYRARDRAAERQACKSGARVALALAAQGAWHALSGSAHLLGTSFDTCLCPLTFRLRAEHREQPPPDGRQGGRRRAAQRTKDRSLARLLQGQDLGAGEGAVTAHFSEAIFPPGMRTRVHSHPGPEAFYAVEGEQCMETPTDRRNIAAGGTYVVPEGPHLQAAPHGRRNLVLIVAPKGPPFVTPGATGSPATSATIE